MQSKIPGTVQLALTHDHHIITTPGHTMAVVRLHSDGPTHSPMLNQNLTVLATGAWSPEAAKHYLQSWLERYIAREPGLP